MQMVHRRSRSPVERGLARLTLGLALLLLTYPGPLAAQDGSDPAAAEFAELAARHSGGLSYELYQVRPGDTPDNVAARFGIRASDLRRLNAIADGDTLEPGRALAIPLPGRPQPAPAQPNIHPIDPCYAMVVNSMPITAAPAPPADSTTLYRPDRGAQLVVHAEHGDYWGLVMVDGSTGWIPKSALELSDRTIAPDTLQIMLQGGRPDVVREALRYVGTPYRYGGTLPDSVDCSLLVQTVFAARGMSLPRTAAQQFEIGRRVNYTELLPGDRLYFVSTSGRINHTGIYIGGGRFVHASSRHNCVAVDSLKEPLYWRRFAGARRS